MPLFTSRTSPGLSKILKKKKSGKKKAGLFGSIKRKTGQAAQAAGARRKASGLPGARLTAGVARRAAGTKTGTQRVAVRAKKKRVGRRTTRRTTRRRA